MMVLAVLIVAQAAQIATATELGKQVDNVALFSYRVDGSRPRTVLTNTASFTIEAARTDSTIEFFRYAPGATNPQYHSMNGSDYRQNGNFVPMPAPLHTNGSVIDTSAPIPLLPATTYLSGEMIFVRVTDPGQNGDANRIETIVVTITTGAGDEITLRLYESGPDTGEFWAYVPSSRDTTAPNDTELTTPSGTTITGTYVDAFDSTETSIDTALVDPYGRVFNSVNGDLIDGARVTIINDETGEPAQVFGIDGMSDYPATVISGQDTSDASGLTYPMRPGEFRFPLMEPGHYHIVVEPPAGYQFASSFDPTAFANLNNAPFVVLADSSYGHGFNLDGSGPLNFDIPLDGETDLILTKTASQSFGDIGDFIGFSIGLENRGDKGGPVILKDTLPPGFKYKQGTSRLDGVLIADPEIQSDGRTLIYRLGPVDLTETRSLNYVTEIGAGARLGEAVNEIVAVNNSFEPTSNIARATVTLREELLRSTSTIIGRVARDACDGNEDWARAVSKGLGIAGVRIYMENGAYAISDQDGLFHFEGVKSGTHVVQLDEETLPKGYSPMVCEENSGYAGRAISKFVEVQGGGLWRANFYLEQTGELETEETETVFDDQTEYKQFNIKWLEAQTADVEWVYPSPERTPSTPSVNIGIKHGPKQRVDLLLNGHKVPSVNFEARETNRLRTVMISRWRGVDILEGKNTFVARIKDMNGETVQTLTRDIHFVKNIARAIALPDQSVLVADGRTNPVLAVRLEDEAGRPVHAGRITTIDVPSPYRLLNASRFETEEELITPLTARADVSVGPDGIARITLEPTLQTGKVTVVVKMDDGREVTLFMYLEPEKRDWIIVGLAEGSVAYNSLKNKSVTLSFGAHDELERDGRVAFFAKGLIKGDWLLTLAVDTDKRRGDRDGNFRPEIDPNAYYTLYGDKSYNAFEAVSRYPVYVKLEKKSFYAMFGDYDTNITEGKLTRYSRHLSGIKSEYLGQKFQVTLFAAETNQGFAKDELAAAGVSGPYQLTHAPILEGSETVTIETRDRTRPDRIIETRRMVRHLDYRLDHLTGELVFRMPVDVSDSGFNPNVIVVDYETSETAERNVSYGGRVQAQLRKGKVRVGSTFAHEGGNTNSAGAKGDMIGVDMIAQLREGTELRLEYALTSHKDAQNERQTANAYLAEIVHTSDKLTADVYVRQEEKGYGLAQRSSTTADIRRYGANANYKISEFESQKNGRRGSRNVAASFYREDNLGTGDSRTLGEITLGHEGETLGATVGLRQVKDDIVGRESRESLLALASVRYSLPKHGATFQISHEQPIGGKNGVDDFPQRTRLSVDKTITKKASVQISHDILAGDTHRGQNTALGITYAPWAGTQITAGSDMITSDGGRRIGATIGLDQQFQLSETWSVSGGLSNRHILSQSGTIDQIAPDLATSSLEVNENYTAAYVGLGYRTKTTSITSRVEGRAGTTSSDQILSLAAAREVSETLSFAGAVRATFRQQDEQAGNPLFGKSTRIDSRFGVAWRPRSDGFVVLNRFDLIFDDALSGIKTSKLI
ncbi:MAG TPA: carboxypeptidase regulatory-like domain-containing protein, partial [Hellea balneolensis]|nr:carboxypeptidase regulatory-like domain-containing protein [Hellea balneolensis]